MRFVEDADGSAAMGWLGPGVFYVRFVGGLSADLGKAHLEHLSAALTEAGSLQYFSDSSALKQYDLLARSAFTRFVLAERRRFLAIVQLTWSQTQAAKAFAAAVGEPVDIVTDPLEFEAKILRAAPRARERLDPKTWLTVGSDSAIAIRR